MPDIVALFRTFVRVVEAGSFTAVAAESNTSQPTISRQIAALEERVGALLFQRTTRALTLTDDGRVLYEQARQTLDSVQQALGSVGRRRLAPSGTLRLACPVVFGRLHIVPRLSAFLARHPEVAIDLVMNDGFTDLVEEGIDLAIRIGELADSSLISRRLVTIRHACVASPALLERLGTPEDPRDLSRFPGVFYSLRHKSSYWRFADDFVASVTSRLEFANGDAVREAAIAGLGVAMLPTFIVHDAVRCGALSIVLADHMRPPIAMYALHPSMRNQSARSRAFIDFLVETFEGGPFWDQGLPLAPLQSDRGGVPSPL